MQTLDQRNEMFVCDRKYSDRSKSEVPPTVAYVPNETAGTEKRSKGCVCQKTVYLSRVKIDSCAPIAFEYLSYPAAAIHQMLLRLSLCYLQWLRIFVPSLSAFFTRDQRKSGCQCVQMRLRAPCIGQIFASTICLVGNWPFERSTPNLKTFGTLVFGAFGCLL